MGQCFAVALVMQIFIQFMSFLLLFGLPCHASSNAICSPEFVFGDCGDFTSGSEILSQSVGGLVPNFVVLLAKESAGFAPAIEKQFYSTNAARIVAGKKVFNEIRRIAIEFVQKQRHFESLSKSERSLVARLRSVDLAIDSETGEASVCRKAPGAFHFDGGKIIACDSLFNLPLIGVARTLAHEIGHVIDPCTTMFDLGHLSQKQVARISDLWGSDIQSNSSSNDLTLVGSSVPLKNNPLGPVVECTFEHMSLDLKDSQNQRLDIARDDIFKLCADSSFSEAFADVVSTILFGRWLAGRSEKEIKRDRYALMPGQLAQHCTGKALSKAYLNPKSRLNLLLSTEMLQTVFNCKSRHSCAVK